MEQCMHSGTFIPAFRSAIERRGVVRRNGSLSRKRLKDVPGIDEARGRNSCFLPSAMYEKKLPFDIGCGIRIAAEMIGGK